MENEKIKDQNISIDEFLRQLEVDDLNNIVEIETYDEIESYSLDLGSETLSQSATLKEVLPEKEGITERMRQLEKERDEMVDFLNRQQKDFENYKRRIERERFNVMDNLMTDFAKKLLPIVDNLDRAIDASKKLTSEKSEEFKHFLDGIVLVNQQLYELLAEMGVEPIVSVGEPFDPYLHEAVVVEKTESVPDNTVIAELLRGYKMGEKVIRHALVKVAVNTNRRNAETAQA
jgi:molecular chaperone GrpE